MIIALLSTVTSVVDYVAGLLLCSVVALFLAYVLASVRGMSRRRR